MALYCYSINSFLFQMHDKHLILVNSRDKLRGYLLFILTLILTLILILYSWTPLSLSLYDSFPDSSL